MSDIHEKVNDLNFREYAKIQNALEDSLNELNDYDIIVEMPIALRININNELQSISVPDIQIIMDHFKKCR